MPCPQVAGLNIKNRLPRPIYDIGLAMTHRPGCGPQKVNWFILYQSADKMATPAPIFLEVWLGVNESVKGMYGNSSAFGE